MAQAYSRVASCPFRRRTVRPGLLGVRRASDASQQLTPNLSATSKLYPLSLTLTLTLTLSLKLTLDLNPNPNLIPNPNFNCNPNPLALT